MTGQPEPVTLADLQSLIREMYGPKDVRRGAEATFLYFMEEVGELATAIRSSEPDALAAEFADVLAWLATLANTLGVDLTDAVGRKYGRGCPGCGQIQCICDDSLKP